MHSTMKPIKNDPPQNVKATPFAKQILLCEESCFFSKTEGNIRNCNGFMMVLVYRFESVACTDDRFR